MAAMKRLLLFSLLACLVFVFLKKLPSLEVRASLAPIATVAPTPYVFNERKLWEMIENWRKDNNLPQYLESEFTCSVADHRVKEIVTDYSHNQFRDHIWCPTCKSEYTISENINTVYPSNLATENGMLDSWLNSASHSANLKFNYSHSCLRCDQGYCVQIFAYF